MRAKGRIRYGYAFHVPGINFVNPITRADTGYGAVFTATKEYEDGDLVDEFNPLMFGPGSPFHNVTRVEKDDDIAVEGYP